jgi:hypothetical protein
MKIDKGRNQRRIKLNSHIEEQRKKIPLNILSQNASN